MGADLLKAVRRVTARVGMRAAMRMMAEPAGERKMLESGLMVESMVVRSLVGP